MGNTLIKLGLLAGWTGLVLFSADKLGWMGDGLMLTDLFALGVELGGAQVIANGEGPLK